MRIAVDYDKTYTADPSAFKRVIEAFREHGHSVVCVTMRRPDEAQEIVESGAFDRVFTTSRQAKARYMQALGVAIDIWIDDSPYWIVSDSA